MQINNHLLEGDNVKFVRTPNIGKSFSSGLPDTIIIHYTAGASAESSIKSLCDPASKASAHLVIGRDGSITQLAPFNIVTWHAGESNYEGRVGFNQYSIGIEIDNPGPLKKGADGFFSWFGKRYDAKDVIEAPHKNDPSLMFWHTYTEQQIEIVFKLCLLLRDTYNIKLVLGHEEISPKRKNDPGPAFPLSRLREKTLGAPRNSDAPESDLNKEGVVMASKLNVRSAPSETAGKIASPLPQGTKVIITESQAGWHRIKQPVEGWVASKFIN